MKKFDLIYGINAVREGLNGEFRRPLELCLLRETLTPRLAELLELTNASGLPVRRLERRELDRITGHSHHQGVVLKVAPFVFAELEDILERWRTSGARAFLLLLDGITDPHNLGAIIRSAEAAGCHGVILPKDRSCPITPVVDKVSAGALAHLPLCQVTNLARTMDELKRDGLWLFGLAGEEKSSPLFGTDLRTDVALVVGSEGAGLRPNIRSHCDGLLAIPMQGLVSSLNASVAAGIALFEVLRQRQTS